MKKILLATALLLSAAAANAQVSWTVRAGANLSGIENNRSDMKFGWKAGAGMDYSFSKLFSLRPMLYYSTKGCSYGKAFSPDATLRLGYLELPMMASFHFDLGKNTSLATNIGPYAAYRVAGKSLPSDVKFNKFDAGAGIGIDFINHGFVIGIEAQYGFTKLAATPAGNLHNVNYSLSVGYNF